MNIDDLYENTVSAEAGELDNVTETASGGLAILTERVERLMQFCEQLVRDNQVLHHQQEALQVERDELHEKNQQLRSRIEVMIVRLKSLEQAL